MAQPPRLPDAEDWSAARPVYVVWELTLACDQQCSHCGSRAGRKRPGELTLEECRHVVDQLAALGTREITLIGGEAYLRPDWVEVVRAISDRGMLCTMQTGGRGLTAERLDAAVAAGLRSVGVSIDGPDDVHDALRRVRGSAASAWHALSLCRDRGLPTTVNTTVTPAALPRLEEMFERVIAGYDACSGRAWSVDPERVSFSDFATEVCDAVPSYIDANRDGWLKAPGNYCPWGPRVISVEER